MKEIVFPSLFLLLFIYVYLTVLWRHFTSYYLLSRILKFHTCPYLKNNSTHNNSTNSTNCCIVLWQSFSYIFVMYFELLILYLPTFYWRGQNSYILQLIHNTYELYILDIICITRSNHWNLSQNIINTKLLYFAFRTIYQHWFRPHTLAGILTTLSTTKWCRRL